MHDDAEARETVRELFKQLEAFSARSGALAFVVARGNPQEYERILESAKKAEQFIGRPMMAMDSEFKSVYTALDDPQSNWCEAIRAMFKPGPRVWSGAEAVAKMQHMNSLYARFEEEERKAEEGYKGDAGFAT